MPFTVARVPTGMKLGVCTHRAGSGRSRSGLMSVGQCAVISKPNKQMAALPEPTVRAEVPPGSGHRAIVPPWLADLAGAWIFYTVLPAWPWPPPLVSAHCSVCALDRPADRALAGCSVMAVWESWAGCPIAVAAAGAWPSASGSVVACITTGLMDTADGPGRRARSVV